MAISYVNHIPWSDNLPVELSVTALNLRFEFSLSQVLVVQDAFENCFHARASTPASAHAHACESCYLISYITSMFFSLATNPIGFLAIISFSLWISATHTYPQCSLLTGKKTPLFIISGRGHLIQGIEKAEYIGW